MLAGGILLMVLGAVIGFLSIGGGLVGLAFGWPIAGAVFAMGFFLALAGALANTIEASTKTVVEELRALGGIQKTAAEALWKQLDAVRTAAGGAPQPESTARPHVAWATDGAELPPPASHRSDMGYCPNCRKLRGFSVAQCVYCGTRAPTVTEL